MFEDRIFLRLWPTAHSPFDPDVPIGSQARTMHNDSGMLYPAAGGSPLLVRMLFGTYGAAIDQDSFACVDTAQSLVRSE
jgi:hypothetical protein